MNMHWIDWSIIAGFAVALVTLALFTQRYMKSVADFLAANRSAGRYLLTTSHGVMMLGAISVIDQFQVNYEAGFTGGWWGQVNTPVMVTGRSMWEMSTKRSYNHDKSPTWRIAVGPTGSLGRTGIHRGYYTGPGHHDWL